MSRVGRLVAPLAVLVVACNAITGAADLTAADDLTDGGAGLAPVDGPRVEPETPQPDEDDAGADATSPGDASALDADAADAPSTVKRVFVSSTSYTGDLGGLAGGDAKCNALAQAAGLEGTFVAWLSAEGTHARDRVTGAGPWRLVGESEVAVTRAQLVAPPLTRPIGRTETGSAATGPVWTGTLSSGVLAPDSCGGWTRAAGGGQVGEATASNALWTMATAVACRGSRRIYCFQR